MPTFEVLWLGRAGLEGKKQKLVGDDIVDAFRRAGYGAGAIRAVDSYSKISDEPLSLADSLHQKIMNLQIDWSAINHDEKIRIGVKEGHRQARHKAAELVQEAIAEWKRRDQE